jgi:autotransporter-associated beta strand protein
LKLWYNSTNSISSATLVSTLSTSLSAGSHTFSGLNQAIAESSIGYLWITADIAAGATTNRTIAVSTIASSALSFPCGSASGSVSAAGTKTIAVPSTFYSNSDVANTNANNLSNWSSGEDGTGISPNSFATTGYKFIIQSGHQYKSSTDWAGNASGYIQINDGGALDFNNYIPAEWGSIKIAGSGVSSSGAIFNSNNKSLLLKTKIILIDNASINASGGAINITEVDVNLNSYTLTMDGSKASSISSGVISGTGGLTKTGAGTLTLSGTNTYTGPTTINEGILSISSIGDGGVDGNIGQASNSADNLILGGGILKYTGSSASTDRAFTLTAGTQSTLNFATNTLTFTGNCGNNTNGSLIKIGTGILTLSGANTFSGGITLSEGTINIDNNAALGTGIFTINSGTTINALNANRSITNPLSIGGSFTFTGTYNLTQNTGAIALTAAPTITTAAGI